MNKLIIFILILSSSVVYASKARIQALSNSFHLIDAQSIYKKPIDLIYLDDFIVLESGLTTATSVNDNAEAIVVYSLNETDRIAAAVGHQDVSVVEARNFINSVTGTTFEMAQNPLSLFFAEEDSVTSYAFGIFYSNKNNKLANLKELSMGLSMGFEMGQFQVNSLYMPVNTVEVVAGKKFDGNGYWQTVVSYLLDQTLFEFKYITSKASVSTDTSGIVTQNEYHVKDVITLGIADSNLKDDNDFFWGAQIVSTRINCNLNLSLACNKFFTSTVLPVWFGIEASATEWLTVRGSIKQSFLVSTTKDEVGYPAGAVSGATGSVSNIPAGANDSVVSAGLGIKFKNLILDGTLSTATTQTLDTGSFLSQVGLTYNY